MVHDVNKQPRTTPPSDPPPAAPALPISLFARAANVLRAGGTPNGALASIGATKKKVGETRFEYAARGEVFHVGTAWSLTCLLLPELQEAA